MIKITVSEADKPSEPLMKLSEMLDSPYGTVFQQYIEGNPSKEFWISCGHSEKSLVNFWWDEEGGCHKLSTDSKKTLRLLKESIQAKRVDADLKLKLKVKK
jgi:hypothetical protein